MIIAQCVLLTSLATIALVLPAHSTTLPTAEIATTTGPTMTAILPTTAESAEITSTRIDVQPTTTALFQATFITEPATTCDTATMAKPKVTHGDANAPSSSSLSDGFELTSTWIIIIAVGEFTVLTAMPLVIIMILIVAFGCVCKKYKRLKKQLFVPTEVVASSNYCTEMTTSTVKESDIVLTNIIFLDDNIDTDDNVAYGHMARVVERCDMADNMPTMQNAETDRARETRESSHNNLATVEDNTIGNTDHDRTSTGVKDHDDNTISEDDAAEANGETDYVINDLYESIRT